MHTEGLRELSLFTGAGGGLLASRLLGWRTVCAVEIDKYCQRVLLQRQRDGCLDRFPIWDDVRTFDGKPWRGFVDIVTGGDPCQANSNASQSRSSTPSLGQDFLRVVEEVRPWFVFRENPARVRADAIWPADRFADGLEALDYSTLINEARACCVGLGHQRSRLFVFGVDSHPDRKPNAQAITAAVPCGTTGGRPRGYAGSSPGRETPRVDWELSESDILRAADGVANRVDRLKAIGNGIVPQVVVRAWRELSGM